MELYCVSIEVDFCFGLQQERLCKTDLSELKLSVSIAPLWTEFLTHATENITFPKLRLQAVIITKAVSLNILYTFPRVKNLKLENVFSKNNDMNENV